MKPVANVKYSTVRRFRRQPQEHFDSLSAARDLPHLLELAFLTPVPVPWRR